jgi:hypothetical protein
MASLNDVVTVSVTSAPAAPTQPGFGLPLILGAASAFGTSTDKIRFYSGLAGMTSDGFATTDPEYLAAQAVFSQNPTLPLIAVGRRTNKPTMQFKITVLQAVVGKVYTVTVNGVAKNYTAIGGDTTTSIATGLAAAIGTPSGFGAAAGVGAIITITASAAGNWARIAATNPNVDLDCWQSQADAGVQADLTAIANVDSTWYAIISTFSGTVGATNASEVGQISAYAEANGKLYLADVQESLVLSVASNIGSKLKALSLKQTATAYAPDNGAMRAAAWAGSRLPYSPGSETWKFANLSGQTPDVFTATQQANLETNNVNYYYSIGGVGIMSEGITALGGTVASGFIDYVRGLAWLISRIQNRIFVALTSPATTVNPATGAGLATPQAKIPFSDAGIGAIEAELRGALSEGVASGFLLSNPAPTVTVPKAAAVTLANRNSRNLSPVTWTATTAGAVHNVAISGVLQ